ncbi:MAG TPA: ATP-binding cassette domain-containing protein [Rhizomicrobium sp.]|jgi:capsular polysaccharide transport system ATP-binding protein
MTLSVRNVCKKVRSGRGKVQLFDGLNVEVGPGDRTALFGGAGAGKSAVLNLMTGSLEPDTGRVERHGFISWPLPGAPFVSKDLTGATNVRFLARLYDLDEDEYLDRVLRLTDVSHLLNDRIVYWPKLLKSEFQSALGWCLNFDTYLFDGRFAAGSKGFITSFKKELAAMEPHKSLFIATEDPRQVTSFCTQAYVLYNQQAVHFPVLEEGIAFFTAINDTKGVVNEEEQEDLESDDDDDPAAFVL